MSSKRTDAPRLLRALLACAALSSTAAALASAEPPPRSFAIENDTFVLDGAPIQLMSGEFHYSRCPAALWRDRLRRLAAMGLNAVATYVP